MVGPLRPVGRVQGSVTTNRPKSVQSSRREPAAATERERVRLDSRFGSETSAETFIMTLGFAKVAPTFPSACLIGATPQSRTGRLVVTIQKIDGYADGLLSNLALLEAGNSCHLTFPRCNSDRLDEVTVPCRPSPASSRYLHWENCGTEQPGIRYRFARGQNT